MRDLTVNEIVSFFDSLNLQKKVEVLNRLTNSLSRGIGRERIEGDDFTHGDSEGDKVIDELFGVWKEEGGLDTDSVINRTTSGREIQLN